jgi:hypothetical protein
VIPCPSCKALSKPGSSAEAIGLKRVRSKRLLAGERLYRCGDCAQLWRCDESDVDRMTLVRGTLETTGERAVSALPDPVRKELGA